MAHGLQTQPSAVTLQSFTFTSFLFPVLYTFCAMWIQARQISAGPSVVPSGGEAGLMVKGDRCGGSLRDTLAHRALLFTTAHRSIILDYKRLINTHHPFSLTF